MSLQTPLHEVLKLPELVSHYMEHKEGDASISLLSFLKMHYADNAADGDYSKHMQLPFKHCCTPIFLVLTTVTNKVQVTFRNYIPECKQVIYGYINPFLKIDFKQNIWQPPKVC